MISVESSARRQTFASRARKSPPLIGVDEEPVHRVALVGVVLGGVDAALRGDRVRAARAVLEAEGVDRVALAGQRGRGAGPVPYETGIARFREIARGQIMGDDSGMFKMIFQRDNGRLLGAHCIGTGATELIHIGQAVLGLGGGLDYFLKTVFNYPTLAECYKVAAYNAANKLQYVHPTLAVSPAVQAA